MFEYGFELALSVLISVLILNITLHMRIKFGNMAVTHVTFKPYKMAYVFLTLAII